MKKLSQSQMLKVRGGAFDEAIDLFFVEYQHFALLSAAKDVGLYDAGLQSDLLEAGLSQTSLNDWIASYDSSMAEIYALCDSYCQ